MKIRIITPLPEGPLPQEIRDLLLGCKVDLMSMMNPEGKDESGFENWVEKIVGEPLSAPTHKVDMEMILDGIRHKHGEATEQRMMDLIIGKYGGVAIMSSGIEIPAANCELVP